MIRIAGVIALLGIVAGCQGLVYGCSDELRSAIRVDVFDSLTGAPAAAGATVSIQGASLTDSVTVPDTVTTSLAQYWMEDRVKAGTYTVQVRKPGYRVWTRNDIRVNANACHVTTFERLNALLQR